MIRDAQRTAVAAERARRSFRIFVSEFWSEIEPVELVGDKYLDDICAALQSVGDGSCKRLAINLAPGLAKSLLVSSLYPVWRMAREPALRILSASYAAELAIRDAARSRRLLLSEKFQAYYPHIRLASDENARGRYALVTGGSRHTASVGSALTGFRCELGIVDDPQNASEYYSAASRDEVRRWFFESFSTRLNDPSTSQLVIVGQRLGVDDLFGSLDETWARVVLPLVNDDGSLISSRWSVEAVERVKRELGSAAFAAQFQQQPIPLGGGLIRSEWFPRYTPAELPASFSQKVVSVDLAFGVGGDNTCFMAAGQRGAEVFILDCESSNKWSFLESCARLRNFCEKHEPNLVLIEAAASGRPLYETLRKEIPALLLVTPVGSKEERVSQWIGRAESGNILLPERAEWLSYVVSEIESFPAGRRDDSVDCLSMALARLRGASQITFTMPSTLSRPRAHL